jgi:hypothetical protein
MALLAGALLLAAGCGSTKLRVSPQDGAADTGSGGALGTGGTGAGTLGSGGTAVTTIPGSGGVGSGGTTPALTGSGGRGSGGAGSGGSPSTGGSPGRGGSPGTGGAFQDAAAVDVPRDQALPPDTGAAVDAGEGCGPGYPLGSSRPAGDGCNTCICNAGGIWACTLLYCPPNDAAVDKPSDAPAPEKDAAKDAAAVDSGPSGCAEVKTEEACAARADCHAVYFDPGGCACLALGCCAQFDQCGDGATAACTGTALCKRVEPHCEGPYVIAYLESCYEGCVLRIDCAP